MKVKVNKWAQMMKEMEDLEKKIEDRFKRMEDRFDKRIGKVVKEMIIGVVKQAADLSYGWGHKEIWRPEGMDLEEDEYRAVDWRAEVGKLRAEGIKALQGGRVWLDEVGEGSEKDEEEEEEKEEEEKEDDKENYEEGEDDIKDRCFEGDGDLEMTSVSGEE